MEYTTKHKLSKPTYDDDVDIQVLNNNMDIIDGKLQSVSVVDNTLHIDDKIYPLNFLLLTGGNVTGDITVKNCPVIYIVETITSGTQTAVKLSNGTLIQYGTIDNPGNVNIMLTYTFASPFIDSSYLVFTTINGDSRNTDGTVYNVNLDISAYTSRAKKTNTSCIIQCDDYALGINVLAIGKWK